MVVEASLLLLLFLRKLLLDSQKTATAVAHCKEGNGLIKVNGFPLHLVEPATLRYKVPRFTLEA